MSGNEDDDPRMITPNHLINRNPTRWSPVDVLNFLQANKEEWFLDDEDIDLIWKNKVAGAVFIGLTKGELATAYKLPLGPATVIEKFINELSTVKTIEGVQKEVCVSAASQLAPCTAEVSPCDSGVSLQEETPPAYRNIPGSASYSHSQFHKNLDDFILEEIRGTVFVDVRGFETFFNHVNDASIKKPQRYSFVTWGMQNEKDFEKYGKLLFTEIRDLNSRNIDPIRGFYGSGGIALDDSFQQTSRKCGIFLSHKLPADQHQAFMDNISQTFDTPEDPSESPPPGSERYRFSWRDVLVVGEFKPQKALDVSRDLIIQLTGHVREVFGAQPSRQFAHAFSVCGYQARLWIFDRAGVSASTVMDLSQEEGQKSFLCALVGYMNMSPSQLGFHERYKDSSGGAFLPCRTTPHPSFFELGDKRMKLVEIIHWGPTIVSRGTLCWKAKENGEMYVIKDAWRDQKTQHEATLWRVAQQNGVIGCLEILDAFDAEVVSRQDPGENNIRRNLDFSTAIPKIFQKGGVHQMNATSISELSDIQSGAEVDVRDLRVKSGGGVQRKKRGACPSNERSTQRVKLDFTEARVHNFIVMKNVGERLETISCAVELLEVVRDAIKCHESLYEAAEILHSDISIHNVMKASEIGRDGLKGFLIDFDYAQRISPDEPGTPPTSPIGTIPFMALEILLHRPVVHTWRHDLESFLYVLIWICVEKPYVNLEEWCNALKCLKSAQNKLNSLSNTFDEEVLARFKPRFKELRAVATNLRDIIFTGHGTHKFKMYLSTPTGDEARKAMYSKCLTELDKEIERLREKNEHQNAERKKYTGDDKGNILTGISSAFPDSLHDEKQNIPIPVSSAVPNAQQNLPTDASPASPDSLLDGKRNIPSLASGTVPSDQQNLPTESNVVSEQNKADHREQSGDSIDGWVHMAEDVSKVAAGRTD